MKYLKLKFLLGLCLSALLINLSYARDLEIGAGFFATSLPHYLGSKEQSSYLIPLPYVYYKSDKIEIDRNAFNGAIWQNKRWYLDFSVSGSIPVKSDETSVRQGMNNIDFVGEFGPAIKYYLIGPQNIDEQLYLALNLRKAIATDGRSIDNVGWTYGPSVKYEKSIANTFGGDVRFSSSLNIDFADERYLNYFYGITEQFVNQSRSFYQADSGYRGASISTGFSWKRKKLWIGSFVKYANLSNSSQLDSPLVTAKDNWSFGLGLVWIFYKR